MFLIFRRLRTAWQNNPTNLADYHFEHFIELSKEEKQHCRAKRIKPGEMIYLGDGKNKRWRLPLLDNYRLSFNSSLKSATHYEPKRIVCMALAERSRLEKDFLGPAVQLGMSHFQPLCLDRSLARSISIERVKSILVEAAVQSQRFFLARLLSIKNLSSLHILLQRLHLSKEEGGRQKKTSAIIVLDPNAKLSFESHLSSHPQLMKETVVLIIGPEGGFSPSEMAGFENNNYTIARLGTGKNILRIGVAGLAGLAKLMAE